MCSLKLSLSVFQLQIIRIIVKLSPDVVELFDDALPSATSKDNNIDCASFDDLSRRI